MSDGAPSLPPGPDAITSLQWRQILDSATDTAIITTDPAGLVTSWSAGARRILGWATEDMVGQTLDRLFTPEDQARGLLAGEMAQARSSGRGGGEEGWRVRQDGQRIWAAGEMTPIHDALLGVVGFIKILRDRTAQRRAEDAVREERRALAVLNRAGSALAMEPDLHRLVQIVTDAGVDLTGAQFGAFFYNVANEQGESYRLYTLSGAVPEAFAGFPMPRNTALFAPTFSGTGIVRSDDITQDPRYGRNAPHGGMPKGHLPVRSYLAVPVTARSGEVLGALFFGHAQPGVFNDRSEAGLSGLAAEAAVAIDNARLSQSAQAELAERRRAEEALRVLNATLEQQVTERTAELERQAAALRQSQKMEVVGQLTGGVAHDFNNLLQIIIGNLDMLQRKMPSELPRLQQAAGHAMSGARRAAALTQRLLAFSRRQPLAPKPLDCALLVQGMSEMLLRTLGETVTVETRAEARGWLVEADPNELEAALLNLAVNARDAMPDGGRLLIDVRNVVLPSARPLEDAMPDAAPAGEYVAVAVIDSGAGMSAETIAQAFEPFFTTKPVGQGTGLGLSQVYGFVRQSGGYVKIVSVPGAGARITLLLPRLLTAPAEAAVAVEPPLPPSGNQETVLVLEDDDDVRRYSVATLNDLGYRVLEAADGLSALAVLGGSGTIDLLFTDVVLPGGLTGAQVAVQAQEMRPGLRVLYTTGYARNAIMQGSRLDPSVRLLQKPFTVTELAAKLRDVLGGAAPV